MSEQLPLDDRDAERGVLLRRIASGERALELAVHDLSRATQERLSLGHLLSQAPYEVLLGAMAVGFWLGIRD
jgi:hypothetical protein